MFWFKQPASDGAAQANAVARTQSERNFVILVFNTHLLIYMSLWNIIIGDDIKPQDRQGVEEEVVCCVEPSRT